ncbi:MAG: hypothetical protein HKN76_08560, partial [Saprospiraceae bacterium]|nr:hypothetical protein [Saprospiraceae bacterium]
MVHSGDLDGCEWMIRHRDGRMLLPQNAQEFEWVDQQAVMFSYTSYDGMSICMAEDEIITLTCLQRLGDMACNPTLEIADIAWLDQLIEAKNPVLVSRYALGNQLYYKILYADKTTNWHDCQGKLMCSEASGCDFSKRDLVEESTVYV